MKQKTPKEYAQQLIDKFADIIPIEASMSDTAKDANEKILDHYSQCKQCSLIAVEEILNLNTIRGDGAYFPARTKDYDYWIQVKQHLQNF